MLLTKIFKPFFDKQQFKDNIDNQWKQEKSKYDSILQNELFRLYLNLHHSQSKTQAFIFPEDEYINPTTNVAIYNQLLRWREEQQDYIAEFPDITNRCKIDYSIRIMQQIIFAIYDVDVRKVPSHTLENLYHHVYRILLNHVDRFHDADGTLYIK